jgi:SAM-dependent methyltransferase
MALTPGDCKRPQRVDEESLAAAYSRTGTDWQVGPGRIYDRLAEIVLLGCPVPVNGARVLDVGAGTGAGSRAAREAGAEHVVAIDAALGMLLADVTRRPPAAVADALRLPFAEGSFDVAVALFSLNHVNQPAAGMREAARVLRGGGGLVVSAYADDDTHAVKTAAESAAADRGWHPAPWYQAVRRDAVPKLATVERAMAVARDAGLRNPQVEKIRVPFPQLRPADLVAWRLGMAQLAPFVATLSSDGRAALAADAQARLGPSPPTLVRSLIVITALT